MRGGRNPAKEEKRWGTTGLLPAVEHQHNLPRDYQHERGATKIYRESTEVSKN